MEQNEDLFSKMLSEACGGTPISVEAVYSPIRRCNTYICECIIHDEKNSLDYQVIKEVIFSAKVVAESSKKLIRSQ